jgi:hypothetical protein
LDNKKTKIKVGNKRKKKQQEDVNGREGWPPDLERAVLNNTYYSIAPIIQYYPFASLMAGHPI